MAADFDVRIEWSADDGCFAASFLRDGKPWFLNGALVGMSLTRNDAVHDLVGQAEWLVINGENFLSDGPISLADREWLFALLDRGPSDNDNMYCAMRAARDAASAAARRMAHTTAFLRSLRFGAQQPKD